MRVQYANYAKKKQNLVHFILIWKHYKDKFERFPELQQPYIEDKSKILKKNLFHMKNVERKKEFLHIIWRIRTKKLKGAKHWNLTRPRRCCCRCEVSATTTTRMCMHFSIVQLVDSSSAVPCYESWSVIIFFFFFFFFSIYIFPRLIYFLFLTAIFFCPMPLLHF